MLSGNGKNLKLMLYLSVDSRCFVNSPTTDRNIITLHYVIILYIYYNIVVIIQHVN